MLWTYAEPRDGELVRVGGGTYDPATDTYTQGAFNADDVSRAAVVYIRHWVATGATSSRDAAYEMLRGLTYLQTTTGEDAGNVVLWMQPDGTLNPSAEPVELPDPSDSDASYWVARTIWALGEGYAAFAATSDPADVAFAALPARPPGAVGGRRRQPGARQVRPADVGRRPADARVADRRRRRRQRRGRRSVSRRTSRPGAARQHARRWHSSPTASPCSRTGPRAPGRSARCTRGPCRGRSGTPGARRCRPRSPARHTALGTPAYLAPAVKDSAVFTPWLLTSGGPDNGRMPTRLDQSQIAYGADSRVQSLLATAEATGKVGLRQLAGMQAAWFFGANAAGVAAYDPATGRTIDGISGDGVVNRNSGAESTIHGLLTMLALDANPDVAAAAQVAAITERVGTTTLQAEDATTTGAARVVAPESLWTGESLFGGDGLPRPRRRGDRSPLGAGRRPGPPRDAGGRPRARTAARSPPGRPRKAGRWAAIASGDIGAQGASPAPGALLPVTLPRTLAKRATVLRVATSAADGDEARIDAVMLEPLVSRYVLAGDGHATALLRSAGTAVAHATVRLPGGGPAVVEVYDGAARLLSRSTTRAQTARVTRGTGRLHHRPALNRLATSSPRLGSCSG